MLNLISDDFFFTCSLKAYIFPYHLRIIDSLVQIGEKALGKMSRFQSNPIGNKELIQEVSKISNNIDDHIPLGVLYMVNWPRMLSKGAEAPDHWLWFDISSLDDPEMVSGSNKKCSLLPLMIDLRYLLDRGHIKMTYRVVHRQLLMVRLYWIPTDILGHHHLIEFRDRFRRGKSPSWHHTRYRRIMMNLLMVLDYDKKSWWGFKNWKNKEMIIFSCTRKFKPFHSSDIGSDFLGKPTQDIFNSHVERLINSKAFTAFTELPEKIDMETRLLNLYNGIHSPVFDMSSNLMTPDQKSLILDILNNDIDGLKSELYPYQKQSVLKMLEREFFPQRMTTFLNFNRDKTYFLDLTVLEASQHPEVFVTPRGGILLENMGLGKTFICLALICCSKQEISQIPEQFRSTNEEIELKRSNSKKFPKLMDLCIKKLNNGSVSWKPYSHLLSNSCLKALEENPGSFVIPQVDNPWLRKSSRLSTDVEIIDEEKKLLLCNTTLVITPDNLFHQWIIEIKKHLVKDFLKILKINRLDFEIPPAEELIKYDLVMISNSAFSNQAENEFSPLKKVYWKRLVIDEGHSVSSKLSRAVYMIKNLLVERKWAISGTPTAGLTRLHMNEELEEDMVQLSPSKKTKKNYVVKRKFDVNQDLVKLGVMVSSFFQIDPWSQDLKLWTKQIVKPFLSNLFGSDLQLDKILTLLIVRHELEDIEKDVKLPPLHHKTVFLKPSFHDKVSLNLFTAVLATNAVTSERKDQDYMFHPSNRSELRRLVSNLQKLTFYWTGFTINDMEVLISICELAKKKEYANGKIYYNSRDLELLDRTIQCARLALSNPRWRTVSAIHEMNYFVKDLPTPFTRALSTGVVDTQVSTYGAPQLNAAQKFFYKNRFVHDLTRLTLKLQEFTKPFWTNYWKDTERKNIQRIKNRDGQAIDSEAVTEALNPDMRFVNATPRKRKASIDSSDADVQIITAPSTPKKALKTSTKIGVHNTSPRQLMESSTGGIKTANGQLIDEHQDLLLIDNIRKLQILGTASSKLSYLASRLLEHEMAGVKSIVFFEFEESAYYLTELLDLVGANYLMYATFIKLNQRLLNLSQFSNSDKGMTLVMDLKLASHGLTIIAATRVYFINPIWKKAVELQAIKRAHRIGQTEEVFVETIILRDTIEEEMFKKRINDDKKPEKDVEAVTLIDDTGMQEFISKHIFLEMELEDDEICKFELPLTVADGLLRHAEISVDDGSTLLGVEGAYKEGMRKWKIPLFTEANLVKQNEHLQSKKLATWDDLDANIEQNGRDSEVEELSTLERINLARQLRFKSDKSVKFL